MNRALWLQTIISLLAAAILLLACETLPPLRQLELRLYDLRVFFQPPQPPHPSILLLHLHPEELPRLLQTLRKPAAAGLKAVGLDLPESFLSAQLELLKTAEEVRFPFILGAHLDSTGRQLRRPPASLERQTITAFADYPTDDDGMLRRQPASLTYRSESRLRRLPAFSRRLLGALPDPPMPLLLHPQGGLSVLDISDFLLLDQAALRGKYLIVADGQKPLGLKHPLHRRLTQLELHGQMLNSWLQHSGYRYPPLFNLVLPLLLALLGLALLQVTLRWGILVSNLSIVALLCSYVSINLFCFQKFNLWLNLTAPTLALTASAAAVSVFFNRTEGRQLAAILNTFRRHLPDEMMRKLLEQNDAENLTRHERRVVTVMFTDIRGFSYMGERLPPDQIIRVLNEYLTAMTDIVFNNHGTLDKYIGDGIMAVYGNLGDNNPRQNAYHAVKTALEMRQEIERLQKKWMREGLRPIQIRIGINSGEALVGYVGHPKHKEVTVIGDTVNTAARIEKLNKKYHTHILISHSTWEYVKELVEARPLGEEKLTGKSSSVKIYDIKGWKERVEA